MGCTNARRPQAPGRALRRTLNGRWTSSVGAHADVVTLIRSLCERGLALLVASSELDELVAVSDRIVVLRDRRKVGEIAGAGISRENIVATIAGDAS